jgi:hypothetical protein
MIRKLHRLVGVVVVPLVLVQAVTGLFLRLRLGGPSFHALHSWFKYIQGGQGIGLVISAVVAVGLVWMVVTGTALFVSLQVQKAKRARRRAAGAGRD